MLTERHDQALDIPSAPCSFTGGAEGQGSEMLLIDVCGGGEEMEYFAQEVAGRFLLAWCVY